MHICQIHWFRCYKLRQDQRILWIALSNTRLNSHFEEDAFVFAEKPLLVLSAQIVLCKLRVEWNQPSQCLQFVKWFNWSFAIVFEIRATQISDRTLAYLFANVQVVKNQDTFFICKEDNGINLIVAVWITPEVGAILFDLTSLASVQIQQHPFYCAHLVFIAKCL